MGGPSLVPDEESNGSDLSNEKKRIAQETDNQIRQIRYDQHFSQTARDRLHYVSEPQLIMTENLRESLVGDIPPRKVGDDLEQWIPIRWYMFLNAFPIIATSMGPFANLCSCVSIADVWRRRFVDGVQHLPKDEPWVYTINAVSLASGCIANLALFLEFSQTVRMTPLEIIAVGGYYFSAISLLVLIVVCQFVYYSSGEYQRFQGYWFGAIASALYFIGAFLLTANDIAHLRGMKLESKRLTQMQKRIIILNVILMVWLGMGGAVFAFLTDNTFGSGVYFCLGVCLTVAYGDIVPINNLGRALIIPYAWIGVLLIGLTIAAIVNAYKEVDGISLVYRRIESKRYKLYQKLKEQQSGNTPKEVFGMMRNICMQQKSKTEGRAVIIMIFVFIFFWLVGSMVFSFTEPAWSYFDAIYFSGLSFVANGFGDYTPTSPGSRAFFCIWAIAALPMMTSLISGLNDKVFQRVISWFDEFTNLCLSGLNRMGIRDSRLITLRRRRWDRAKSGKKNLNVAEEAEKVARNGASAIDDSGDEEQDDDVQAEGSTGDEDSREDSRDTSRSPLEPYDLHTRVRAGGGNAPIPLGLRRPSRTSAVQRLFLQWPEKVEEMPSGSMRARRMMVLATRIREFTYQLSRDPEVKYEYEDWRNIMELTNLDIDLQCPEFWLSNQTPLRAPITEPTFFLLTCLTALEQDIIAYAREERGQE